MPGKKSLIFIIVLIAILASVKLLFFRKEVPATAGGSSPGSKPAAARAMNVNGMVVSGSELQESILASGTVLANESVELHPEISGKVISILFREGSSVKKGDLLVKLNDADYRSQLSKLESSRKLLIEKADRQKQLFELNGISRQEYDESLNQLAAVEADLQFVRAQIEKTEIRAPFDGHVGLKYVSEGSFVSQDVRIASIQQMNPLKVDFSLPEKYSSYVRAGQKITFSIEGDTTMHSGEVYAVEPRVDPATRSIRIRALATNPGNRILPGVFAKVNFGLNHTGEAVLIPTQAIIPILKGKKVLVAENGMAISRVITTGIRQEKNVEIITGLQQGDTLITSGIMQLRDSMPVTVKVIAY